MATLIWDGNGGNGRNTVWSAWNNWNANRVPQSSDTLVFSGTKKLTNSNDVGGLSIPEFRVESNGFTIGGAAINIGSGGIRLVGGTSVNLTLPFNLSSTATPIEAASGKTLYLNGGLNGAGGIAKYGAGTAVLGTANGFTGNTTIAAGTLWLNNGQALQNSTLDYNNFGGNLNFGGQTNVSLGGLQGSQNLTLANANSVPVRLTVGGNGQPTVYAGVLSGSGGLTKSGAGMLQLTGDNDHSGTTVVSSGTLDIAGSMTNSLIEISGGALAGNGRVKSVDLIGGTLSPGHGVGTLTISLGAVLDNGAVEIELADGTATDQLLVLGGDVVLGSELRLSADANFQPPTAAVIAVVNNSGNGATTGRFSGIAPGQTVTFNNHHYRLLYDYDFGGDGLTNDVVLEPVNSIPAAVADEYVLDEDTLLTVATPGVLANDTDPEGDPLTATLVQLPAHGTVTLHPDGSFTYTPNADFSGVDDALVYRIDDGHGGTAEGTVTFRVQPVNDAPVVGANAFQTVEGSNLAGQLVATDIDSTPLTYALATPPTHGDVIVNADGTFTYKSHALTQTVNDQFTFAVSDGVTTTTGAATVAVFNWNGNGIRPDVLEWLLANNPGLQANFLKTELPTKVIRLPDGRSLPIYQLDQFLDVNFRLTFSARKREGVALVEEQEWQMRKIMAHPEFYNWIKSFAPRYNIAGKGWLSSAETYQFFRNLNRNLSVGVSPRVKAPVGGGGGMTAPSWAVWKQMNIFWHEAMHNVGVGHNTVGLSGPLAGKMRSWDRAKLWNYNTVDLNSLTVPLR